MKSTTNKFFHPRRPGLRRSTLSTTERSTSTGTKRTIITSRSTTSLTTTSVKSSRPTVSRRKYLSPRTTTTRSQGTKLTTSQPTKKTTTTRLFMRKPFRKYSSTPSPVTLSSPSLENSEDQKMDASILENHSNVSKSGQTAQLIAIAQAVNKLQQVLPTSSRLSSLKDSSKHEGHRNRDKNGFSRQMTTKLPPSLSPISSSFSYSTPIGVTTKYQTPPLIYSTNPVTSPKPIIETPAFNEFLFESIPKHTKVILYSDGSVTCLDQGNFPHPTSCKKFISCARVHNGDIRGWQYACPAHLSFDPIGGMCNWAMELGCDER